MIKLEFNATAKSRTGVSVHHLLAACRMALRMQEIEEENKGKELGPFWSELFQNALGVAMLNVAALEAYANELYFEGYAITNYLNSLAAEDVLDLVDRESILNKYSLVSSIRTGKRIDIGGEPAQSVARLIELRNAIVHFRPEWHGENGKHQKLSRKLRDKFEATPFLPDEQLFPRAWASCSFAKWALNSTITFLDHYYENINLNNPLNQIRDQLTFVSEGIV